MAIFTDIRRVNVRGIFARGIHAIVARGTISCHVTVVKFCIIPGVSVVTVIAGIRALNVIGRFALRCRTVMA